MADAALEVQKDELLFHPCTTPRGMSWYNLNVLTPVQQKLLNELKIDTAKENNQYLAKHPEIRAITSLLLRAILKDQPKLKTVADFARDFFNRSKIEIQAEIDEYLKNRGEPLNKQGDSAVNLTGYQLVINPSLDEFTTFHKPDYLTYVSFTTEEESEKESVSAEWSYWGYEDQSTPRTPFSDYSSTDAEFQRKQFETLFSARVSTYSAEEEGYDESTVEIAKEYMRYYTEGEKESTTYDDDEQVILDEIGLADKIQSKLSVIVENFNEEDEHWEENSKENNEDQLDKKSMIEFDLKSLKDRSKSGESGESTKATQILETMLEYECSFEG